MQGDHNLQNHKGGVDAQQHGTLPAEELLAGDGRQRHQRHHANHHGDLHHQRGILTEDGASLGYGKFLQLRGIDAECIHGDIPQKKREAVMDRFRQGKLRAFVSTDVAARGIDVDDVDIVFNCDIPDENQDYIHRIGRTGRAKRQGVAVSFVADYPSKLRIDDIAKHTRNEIVSVRFGEDGHLEVI